jgi:hypothetical protein
MLGAPVKRQSQDRAIPMVDPTPIHERCALDQRLVLLGTTLSEIVGVIQLKYNHVAPIRVDLGHAIGRLIVASGPSESEGGESAATPC